METLCCPHCSISQEVKKDEVSGGYEFNCEICNESFIILAGFHFSGVENDDIIVFEPF